MKSSSFAMTSGVIEVNSFAYIRLVLQVKFVEEYPSFTRTLIVKKITYLLTLDYVYPMNA